MTESSNATDKLGYITSWHGSTAREDLLLSVCKTTKELELSWKKWRGVETDGAPGVVEKKVGLMGRIGREMDKQISEFYMELHWVVRQQLL